MNETIIEALNTLLVGMITVFAVLGLVVLLGQSLIKIVNRWTPEVAKVKRSYLEVANEAIEREKMAAIVAAVEIATKGKGRIKSIKKID